MPIKYPALPGNPCEWEYTATSRIRQALGFKSTKIPAKFHGVFNVDGWKVIVKRGTEGRDRRLVKHRIFVDFNGREIAAGRLRQAVCRVDKRRIQRQRIARAAWRARTR